MDTVIAKVDKIKSLMWEQTLNHPLGQPAYFITLYYGRAYDGDLLNKEQLSERYKLRRVKDTHRFIRSLIHKTFGSNIPMWFMVERHKGRMDEDGVYKEGYYHTHFFMGEIPDDAIDYPSPRLMPLFYAEDEIGIPINMRNVDRDGMKILLLDACIRQAKWVGKHRNSCLVLTPPPYEMEQTFKYPIKEMKTIAGLDLIDWDNSDFYTPNH